MVTVLANGTTYINTAEAAECYLTQLATGILQRASVVDEPAQRAAVVEAELRVRQAMAAGDLHNPAMPALAAAIRGLRLLNRATNDAKHHGEYEWPYLPQQAGTSPVAAGDGVDAELGDGPVGPAHPLPHVPAMPLGPAGSGLGKSLVQAGYSTNTGMGKPQVQAEDRENSGMDKSMEQAVDSRSSGKGKAQEQAEDRMDSSTAPGQVEDSKHSGKCKPLEQAEDRGHTGMGKPMEQAEDSKHAGSVSAGSTTPDPVPGEATATAEADQGVKANEDLAERYKSIAELEEELDKAIAASERDAKRAYDVWKAAQRARSAAAAATAATAAVDKQPQHQGT